MSNNQPNLGPFLATCAGQLTSHTPIWLMRQAGRYQPEYRAIRAKTTFVELCRSPDLAAEVTVLPVRQVGVDAAILFADILLLLEPLGVGFEFTKDDGPLIRNPVRKASDVDSLSEDIRARESLSYVMETIKRSREALRAMAAPGAVPTPLIGFAGAPFTLASYAIEGGGSKNYILTKKFMQSDSGAWHALLAKLTRAVADYLCAQIEAGAQAVQVFDSWIGALGPHDYVAFVQPHMKKLFELVGAFASQHAAKTNGPRVPVIHFGTGNPELIPYMRDAGGDVIGVDWRIDFADASARLGKTGIMGNLDPTLLLAPHEKMFAGAKRILDAARVRGAPGRNRHIFNLGHGVFPETQVDQVRALVDYVHEHSAAEAARTADVNSP